ncbi:haloacid dehalogenase [Clostridia bacterium]|nr:haloacid dehalogenase [Clostridia bacterium]
MIKLIVTDVDGTLVVEGTNQLDPRYVETILALRKKGIQFAVASGRQASSIEYLFRDLKEKIFYLADNGSYIGCYGRILFTFPLDKALVEKLIQEGEKLSDCELMLSTPKMIYTNSKNKAFLDWMNQGYQMNVQYTEDLLSLEEEVIKFSYNRNYGLEEIIQTILPKYGDQLQCSTAGASWVDCMTLGINKGHAVSILQESLDISPEETMVFGDQCNDIEMMKQAYHSYAVENAHEKVKDVARFRTDSHENFGVLKILQTLL